MTKEFFGTTKDGQDVYRFRLLSQNGLEAHVLTYGAIIQKLLLPQKNGKFLDIVLGFNELSQYEDENPFFGSIIGRNANRIAKSEIFIDGKKIKLHPNEGEAQLHGGNNGFGKKNWDFEIENEKLILKYKSPDGEEGYPGNLKVEATFEWKENTFVCSHTASTDKKTVVNLTRHEYFNLSEEPNIRGHKLMINADAYLAKTGKGIPTGEIKPVEKSIMDFRKTAVLGTKLAEKEGGFDHNYVLNKRDENEPAAMLLSPAGNIRLKLFCTAPGLQFFSAEDIGEWHGKYGTIPAKSPALCLEAQHFPDAPHHEHFPSTILAPGEQYKQQIKYQFELE